MTQIAHNFRISTRQSQRTVRSPKLRSEAKLCITQSVARRIVWAIFWIIFQLAALIGFIFIGIVSFKLTEEQMRAEAGKFIATLNLPACDRRH